MLHVLGQRTAAMTQRSDGRLPPSVPEMPANGRRHGPVAAKAGGRKRLGIADQ